MSLTQTGWDVRCDHPGCVESTPPAGTAAHAWLLWREAGGVKQLPGLWPVEDRAEPATLPELYLCPSHTPPHQAPRPAWMVNVHRH